MAGIVVIADKHLRSRYLNVVAHTHLHEGSVFATEGMLAAYTEGGPWLQGAKSYVEDNILHMERFLYLFGNLFWVRLLDLPFLVIVWITLDIQVAQFLKFRDLPFQDWNLGELFFLLRRCLDFTFLDLQEQVIVLVHLFLQVA